MDVKIKDVTICIGKKELRLSLEEARQFKYQMDQLFGGNQATYWYPYSFSNPYPNQVFITSNYGTTLDTVTIGF